MLHTDQITQGSGWMTSLNSVPPCLVKMSYYQWKGIFPHSVKEQAGAEEFRSLVHRWFVYLYFHALHVIHKWWRMIKRIVCTGGWRTTRPTWQCGPYGRNLGIHVFCTYKHTRIHKLGSVSVGVILLRGSNSDERRKKHMTSFGSGCLLHFCLFFCRGGLEGKAT